MEESVKVFLRIRPKNAKEQTDKNYQSSLDLQNSHAISITYPKNSVRQFNFDRIFHDRTHEDEVYQTAISDMVPNVLRGINATAFVYGQTGSGKTHTMGLLKKLKPQSRGVVPSVLRDLFQQITTEDITLSFLQIYMENIYDLLNPSKKALKLREDKQGDIFIKELIQVPITDFQQAIALISAGLGNRVMGAHDANVTSSRSHTVLMLDIDKQSPSQSFASRLTLIDLAGSERVRNTNSSGIRLNEAKFINGSLSALGKVVCALTSGQKQHIPFRDSKLTRLLQPSLNGKVAMIATIGPSLAYASETLSTLQFASRCKEIVTTPTSNIKDDIQHGVEVQEIIEQYREREAMLLERIRQLEEQPSSIFSHNANEAVYYLVRVMGNIQRGCQQYAEEISRLRQCIPEGARKQIEQDSAFSLNLSMTQKSLIEDILDENLDLNSMPSGQLIGNLQNSTSQLIENLNFLGRCGVENQILKAKACGIQLERPNLQRLTISTEQSANRFHTNSNNTLLQSLNKVICQNRETKPGGLQKVLSIRQLINSRKVKTDEDSKASVD